MLVSGGSVDDKVLMDCLENRKPDVLIGVDSGLAVLYRNQIMPTQIVGDFDSVSMQVLSHYEKADVPMLRLHPVKDETDTECALRLAIEQGVEELWICGATGTRLDHTLANMQLLCIAQDAGVRAYLVDAHNRIYLAKSRLVLKKEEMFGGYFSLFSMGGAVEGLSIRGAKYPLEDYFLEANSSRCVSNEMAEEEVEITWKSGRLLVMETRD